MKKISILSIALLALIGCQKDYLDTEPAEYPSSEQVLTSAAAADAVLNGVYSFMFKYNTKNREAGRHDDFGLMSVHLSTELVGVDMVQTLHHHFGFDYVVDNRDQTYARTATNWNFFYQLINFTNSILVNPPEESTDEAFRHGAGQALAIRGMAYHYLVRLYQHTYKGHENDLGVPIYLPEDEEGKPRSTVQEVYDQIVSDLERAFDLLEGYSRPSKMNVNQNVAAGLLARVYLDMENWSAAAEYANIARTGYSPMVSDAYLEGFDDINNSEWMWGADVDNETTTIFASFFSHMATESPGYAGALGVYKAIDKSLYDQIPDSDIRKDAFIPPTDSATDYVNLKFIDTNDDWTADYVYMRAAEMYLIEAEAGAMAGSPTAAQTLYELVSTRDTEYTLSPNTGTALAEEVRLQRRIELWGEGFGWFDLKRLKKGFDRNYTDSNHRPDALLSFEAEANQAFIYMIPQEELDTNTNLTTSQQNP